MPSPKSHVKLPEADEVLALRMDIPRRHNLRGRYRSTHIHRLLRCRRQYFLSRSCEIPQHRFAARRYGNGLEQFEGLDVAAALSVVQCGSRFAEAYLHVEVGVFEAAVLTFGVEECADIDALRTDVAEFHRSGIGNIATSMNVLASTR